MAVRSYYLLIILSAVSIMGVFAGNKRHGLPLMSEDEFTGLGNTASYASSAKRNHRTAECRFGDQIREMGSTWFADLGPPFGIMYCIKCDCIRIQKKRRIVARVVCRNIKNECPEPTCEEPVLYPGRCCKSCPGDQHSPDIVQVQSPVITPEEEEKSLKHFATLMTERTSIPIKKDELTTVSQTHNIQNVVATGRFTFQKKNLYYSFYVSDKAARPRLLQFIDVDGNILEEQILSAPGGIVNSVYQNATGKICGVWKRVPKDYRRLLKEEKLYVTLVWGAKDQQELALSGIVARYTALGTELFSALMEPAPGTDAVMMAGAGATAIVSISSVSTPSIHITVVFNGVFASDDVADVPINITLMLAEKQDVIIQEIKRVKKPSLELNVLEVSSPVSLSHLHLLTKGRLVLSVANKYKPTLLRLTGSVITRTTCELFQTQLTPSNADDSLGASQTSALGLAWVYLNRNGALVYHVQIEDLKQENSSLITLFDVGGKRKIELEDLTPSYQRGWANGTLNNFGPRFLEPLYSGNLVVNVATQNVNSLVRGRLVSKLVADARDSPAPILLKREDASAPPHLVGMAWFIIDTDCNVHFEINLSGLEDHKKHFSLYLEEVPILIPGAPVSTKYLGEFQGNQLEGFVLNIELKNLVKIDSGISFLSVRELDTGKTLLKGMLKQIKVPSVCLPHINDNDVPTYLNIDNGDTNIGERQSCYHETNFYEEGAQWTSKFDSCMMCHCTQGSVKCDSMKCPVLDCPAHTIRKPVSGACCPTCSNNTEETSWDPKRGCNLSTSFYPPNTRFNPYMPPNGFDYCVECICHEHNLSITCQRKSCPVLKCNASNAVRPTPSSCCKECPYTNEDPPLKDELVKIGTVPKVEKRNREEILAEGGCVGPKTVYENGDEWHPKPFIGGLVKCVSCRCQDGRAKCDRKRCPRSFCNSVNRQARSADVFKYSEPMDECCAQKCNRRNRRHHGHRIPKHNS